VIEIDPPKAHTNLQPLSTAGRLSISTVGTPGTQGATGMGVQGMGVSTPRAAAVAAATAGFAKLVHMPKGNTFTNGALSMMFATGAGANTR
jgi:hypothetical protein